MGCDCGKPKCDGHCGVSPAVLQINNPSECVLFRKVEVPASMGTSVENPPKPGAYRNVLLYYNADGEAYLYSSDGMPTKVTGTTSNYEILTNKPKINGVELVGDKSLADIGVTNAINNALQPYTPRSELAEVAFTGDYNDLENTPPETFARFYMWPPSEGNAAPMYHDYGRTDQVTLAQFTDAIASGPVQIYMEHDGHTFWIYYVDQLDAFIPDPPMAIGTLDVSFGLRSQNQDELGVRRFYWQEGDTAPIYDSYNPNQSDWNQTSPTRSSYIKNKPNLATVATSGSYNDLSNKPTIPAAQVNSDWNASSGVAQILNKPTLASVATSGNYDDLSNKPTIPAAQVNSDWNAASGVAQILNKPSLATVATSGSYNDLTDKPDIPSGLHIFYMLNPSVGNAAPIYHDYRRTDQVTLAQFTDAIASGPVQIYIPYDGNTFRIHYVDQMDAFIPDPPMATGTLYVNFGLRDQHGLGVRRFLWYEPDTAPIFDSYESNQSDWNETSSTNSSYIKNKPNLATVATSGSYNDLSNKPAIPTVNDATLTITQNGTSAGTFTANASSDTTISLTDTTYSDFSGATSSAAGTAGLVPAPAAGDQGKFLQGDGTWAVVQAGPTVVQTTGQSTTDVMSQKAVTDIIGNVETILQTLNSGNGAQ